MIEQYRHGSETVILEIPGGCVDPGEEPIKAAERELLEETGYTNRSAALEVYPLPAIALHTAGRFRLLVCLFGLRFLCSATSLPP